MSNFIDSPKQAHRDTKIQNFHYEDKVFRQFFTTPFEQYKTYVGESFEVVRQIQELKFATDDEDGEDDMYVIRFNDGVEIEAYGHEICQLDYDKCTPIVQDHAEGDKSDDVYHACLDAWDVVRKGMDEEDAAGILIDVVERLKMYIEREEERACQRNAMSAAKEILKYSTKLYASLQTEVE